MSWRPESWSKCPCDDCPNKVIDDYGYVCDLSCGKWGEWFMFEAGADAMLKAVQEHLKDTGGNMATFDYINRHGDYNRWLKECFKEE